MILFYMPSAIDSSAYFDCYSVSLNIDVVKLNLEILLSAVPGSSLPQMELHKQEIQNISVCL